MVQKEGHGPYETELLEVTTLVLPSLSSHPCSLDSHTDGELSTNVIKESIKNTEKLKKKSRLLMTLQLRSNH